VLSVSEVIKNAEGKIVELKATSKKLTETEKPQVQQRLSSTVPQHAQAFIHWVCGPTSTISPTNIEVRVYDKLFV
jgi:hypothetical protein